MVRKRAREALDIVRGVELTLVVVRGVGEQAMLLLINVMERRVGARCGQSCGAI